MSTFISLAIVLFLFIWLISEFKDYGISLVFMAIFWSIIIYGLVPLALMDSYSEVANIRFLSYSYQINSVLPLLSVIIFFLSMYSGAYVTKSFKYRLVLEEKNKKTINTALFLLILGGCSLLFFIYTYGGLDYVIQNMSKIRSGVDDNKNYLAAFVNIFSKYTNFSFFILLALMMSKGFNYRYEKILFIIALFSTLFTVYLSAGRETGIGFLISILVVYYSTRKKVPVLLLSFFTILSFLYILFGKVFLFALNNENFDAASFYDEHFYSVLRSSYNLILSEFSHQYLTLVHFMQGNYEFRYLGDYIYWILKPLKLMGIDIPDSISYYNTFIIYGIWDSEIPPGAIGFGYIQIGSLGLVLHGFLLGIFFRFFDVIFDAKNQDNSILLGFYSVIVTSFTYILSNSDPALFLQNRIPHILFMFFILFFLKARLKYKYI